MERVYGNCPLPGKKGSLGEIALWSWSKWHEKWNKADRYRTLLHLSNCHIVGKEHFQRFFCSVYQAFGQSYTAHRPDCMGFIFLFNWLKCYNCRSFWKPPTWWARVCRRASSRSSRSSRPSLPTSPRCRSARREPNSSSPPRLKDEDRKKRAKIKAQEAWCMILMTAVYLIVLAFS